MNILAKGAAIFLSRPARCHTAADADADSGVKPVVDAIHIYTLYHIYLPCPSFKTDALQLALISPLDSRRFRLHRYAR
jgi:hypothetical protein